MLKINMCFILFFKMCFVCLRVEKTQIGMINVNMDETMRIVKNQ